MQWIIGEPVLAGEKVILRPLKNEYIDGLIAAGADSRIWEFLSVIPEETFLRQWYLQALEAKEQGTQFPFVIFDKEDNIIGSTRFGHIEPEQKKLEIGWTWYKPEIWGKGYNEECKYLLLSYCFDVLKAVRVELKTNEKNIRSRRAIQRLGCKFEGIVRNHVIRQGFIRNTALFSMLPEEWEQSRHMLKSVVEQKYSGAYSYEPDMVHEVYKGYTITTNKNLMQPERIHRWLSEKSYWLPGVPYEVVQTTFNNSFCIAVLHDGVQVGYARFVTDYAMFAYLADVYIEEEHRGKELSKKMMELLSSLGWVKRLRRLILMTKDAHGLYKQFGYNTPVMPERYMELAQPGYWE